MIPFAFNTINIPISKNQKQNLLFNVNQPLELSIEEFEKNGGLLHQTYGLALAVKIMLMVTCEEFLFVGLKNIISQVSEKKVFQMRNVA